MGAAKGSIPHNKLDRSGKRYGKLIALNLEDNNRWLCKCDCGGLVSVLSTNLSHMAKRNGGCGRCKSRKSIIGEKYGLLVAIDFRIPNTGQPIWRFRCRCGNEIEGTVREFHSGRLRSCGCHGNAYNSWKSMIRRCYDPKNNRYKHYGKRGIKVCRKWHRFENFIVDMGECPKRHNLSRLHAEKDYCKSNCTWEHISLNNQDTHKGKPTKQGLLKGAKQRVYLDI